jgi:hypothetical protein
LKEEMKETPRRLGRKEWKGREEKKGVGYTGKRREEKAEMKERRC